MERRRVQQYRSNTATDSDIKSKVIDTTVEENKLSQGELAIVNTTGNESIYHLNSDGTNLIQYLPIERINGNNVKINTYTISDKDDSELAPISSDTVNQAIGKLHKALINDEYVISLGISRINDSCGFDANGRTDFSDTNYLSSIRTLSEAIKALDSKIKTILENNPTLIQ